MSSLSPLDLHAHVDSAIGAGDLEAVNAVVFAVTRSLAESVQALQRSDRVTIWGVGCHPGLVKAQRAFRPDVFSDLIKQTSFVGELGLDGKSRVPFQEQMATLKSALQVLARTPRIVSLHSYAATGQVVGLLEETPIPGVVLHWWLGDPSQTRRAVDLGCYFSVNAASVSRPGMLDTIPVERLLTETDHPFGDRRGRPPRRPGRVEEVEAAIGHRHRLTGQEVRRRMWQNLGSLVRATDCSGLLPRAIRSRLAAVLVEKP